MVNSVCTTQPQYVVPQKINGKNHCRRDELSAYRETIAIANQGMVNAAIEKDNEAVECWSKIIDTAQEKIHNIIEQENEYSYKRSEATGKIIDSTLDVADKALDIADRGSKVLNLVV